MVSTPRLTNDWTRMSAPEVTSPLVFFFAMVATKTPLLCCFPAACRPSEWHFPVNLSILSVRMALNKVFWPVGLRAVIPGVCAQTRRNPQSSPQTGRRESSRPPGEGS